MRDFIRKIVYLGIVKKSYSQDNEDLFLKEYFEKISNGFYVDIGCHHPKRFSNTYLLYKKGWKGVNIDANFFAIKLFNLFRSKDENLNTVVSNSNKPVIFYEFHDSALNGIISKHRLEKLEIMGYHVRKKSTIFPLTINDIIDKFDLKSKKIHFFKIDIEGLDFEIVRSIPFNEIDIELLMIEKAISKKDNDIKELLKINYYYVVYETTRNFIFKKQY